MQGKRNYKDSLFINIFKDKKRLCSLYNALYNVPKSVDTLRRRDFQKVNCR